MSLSLDIPQLKYLQLRNKVAPAIFYIRQRKWDMRCFCNIVSHYDSGMGTHLSCGYSFRVEVCPRWNGRGVFSIVVVNGVIGV